MTLTYMGLAADPQLPANVRRPEIFIAAVLYKSISGCREDALI
jgi:hypothetical protein